MRQERVIVIGGGIGGLSAAIALAAQGREVTVMERAACAGGKMRETSVGDSRIDAGPTVLTMRWVFDELFETAGARLEDHVALLPLRILARHAWSGAEQLDLHADESDSAAAIAAFAGEREARGYLAFCAEAKRMYQTLLAPFLTASKPNPLSLAARIGPGRLPELLAIRPFDTMWRALGQHFRDARVRQLFARYATYCGSSPFEAPATLMLIAHVEQAGVWAVEGGLQRLAEGLVTIASKLGVTFRFGADVTAIEAELGRASGVRLQTGERLGAEAIVCNADPQALTAGLFGHAARHAVPSRRAGARSLSAMTWTVRSETRGFPLSRHNVFFSGDYRAEFDAIFRDGVLPSDPTVYVCAQDRLDDDTLSRPERLLVLANAPARGDKAEFTTAELETCQRNVFARLNRCGLEIRQASLARTTPAGFNRLFPATGGALYGQATHGWAATFRRPGSRTQIPGLYLAGGGVHPGAGVPMAALSGRQAALSVMADRVSTGRWRLGVIAGGTLTRSAKTGNAG